MVFSVVIESSHSSIFYGFSKNLKADFTNRVYGEFHNLFSIFIPSLASQFFITNPYLEGALCISHYCFLIEQIGASSHISVYEINGQ